MTKEKTGIREIVKLIQTLRGPQGCPWDKKQTPRSIAVYLIEEVFELVDAIESGSPVEICEELGDVLFQILFIIQLFEHKGAFGLEQVSDAIVKKMINRHPHVFSDVKIDSADAVREQWHRIKLKEKKHAMFPSLLDSVPAGLPALVRAYRISERAARTGFDWDDIAGVMEKAKEEWGEFNRELINGETDGEAEHRLELEFGDILFTLVNVARFAGIHPETSLTGSIKKFEKRFKYMEAKVSGNGRDIESISREEMDRLWEEAKQKTSGEESFDKGQIQHDDVVGKNKKK